MQRAAWEQRAGAVLHRLGADAPVMAELGVGLCKMARVLLREHETLRLHLVDSFRPATEQPARYVTTRDNFALLDPAAVARNYAEAQRLAESHRVTLHHADTSEAAERFSDGSLDLVFVDADHSYEGVKEDIACWLPKVKAGGWIGGHDYGNSDPRFDFTGVQKAVEEFSRNFGKAVEFDANFTWWVRL